MDTLLVGLLMACGTAVLGWCGVRMAEEESVTATILSLERAALERWGKGDPSGFLEISATEVTYFDPFLAAQLDGLAALTAYYERLRGQVRIDRFELLSPHVAVHRETAVLSFDYRSYEGSRESRWQCTEVYRELPEGWRIVHTHWSRPAIAA